jgi:hypothetical protein
LPGSVAANFHEAGRSEYLAHYVFSGFGTSFLVPRQEDIGIDLFCTLAERHGQHAWAMSPYTVQVKSADGPWKISGRNAIAWLINHPLPVFFCVANATQLRFRVFQTSPRFHLWSLVQSDLPDEITLVPGTGPNGRCLEWDPKGWTFSLSAPIADFTVGDLSNKKQFTTIRKVFEWWLAYEDDNIMRFRMGVPLATLPAAYRTNEIHPPGLKHHASTYARSMTDAQLQPSLHWLSEMLSHLPTRLYKNGDATGALIGATLLRHLKSAENPLMDLRTITLLGEIGSKLPGHNRANPTWLADELIDAVRRRIG